MPSSQEELADDPELRFVNRLFQSLSTRVQCLQGLSQRRALGSFLDLTRNPVGSALMDAHCAVDPKFVEVRQEQEKLKALARRNFDADEEGAQRPSSRGKGASRAGNSPPTMPTSSAATTSFSGGVTAGRGSRGVQQMRLAVVAEGGGGGGGPNSSSSSSSGGGGGDALTQRIVAARATEHKLKALQSSNTGRFVTDAVFVPEVHTPLLTGAAEFTSLRGVCSTSGKAYAGECIKDLQAAQRERARALQAAQDAADARGGAPGGVGAPPSLRAGATAPPSTAARPSTTPQVHKEASADGIQLLHALPTLLKFTCQRLAKQRLGHASLLRVLASPHALALTAGAFWLCALSLRANVELQRTSRLEKELARGLTLEEAREAVSKLEAAEADAAFSRGGGAGGGVEGSGEREERSAAAGVGEGVGAGAGGAAAPTPAVRKAALLKPSSEAEHVCGTASVTATYAPSEAHLHSGAAIGEALAGVYYALHKALLGEEAQEEARGRLAPLRAAAARELREWVAAGGVESGLPRPPPPPAYSGVSAGGAKSGASGSGFGDPVGPPGYSIAVCVLSVLPWAIADAAWHALCVFFAGSGLVLNARAKLEVFVRVGGLLGGVEYTPTAALHAQEALFVPLLGLHHSPTGPSAAAAATAAAAQGGGGRRGGGGGPVLPRGAHLRQH